MSSSVTCVFCHESLSSSSNGEIVSYQNCEHKVHGLCFINISKLKLSGCTACASKHEIATSEQVALDQKGYAVDLGDNAKVRDAVMETLEHSYVEVRCGTMISY